MRLAQKLAVHVVGAGMILATLTPQAQTPRRVNVAHRGASAYAPEHTLAAYRLALEQGADFVEQDLAVTKDGVLICLHDPTLERTTNVEEIYPDRATTVTWEGKTVRAWLANDFTLEEIKRLDAGDWFDVKFSGERVPTFDEAVALVRGRAGLFPELKTPEVYVGRSVDFEALVATALDKHALRGPRADPKTPVILQTFSEASAKTLAEMRVGVPVVLLIGNAAGWDSVDRVRAWKGVVQGFGPAKQILLDQPDFVRWAQGEGLTVTPYTFRSADTGRFPNVKAEMEHFLYTLGVDGLFTDNPDQFPRRPAALAKLGPLSAAWWPASLRSPVGILDPHRAKRGPTGAQRGSYRPQGWPYDPGISEEARLTCP
ncbi:MAG: glycerophosphodiester phosphodiesterase family protein [Vicinamibacterales bacterium]